MKGKRMSERNACNESFFWHFPIFGLIKVLACAIFHWRIGKLINALASITALRVEL